MGEEFSRNQKIYSDISPDMEYVERFRYEERTAKRETEKGLNDAGEDIRRNGMECTSKPNYSDYESVFLDVSDSKSPRKQSHSGAGADKIGLVIGTMAKE